MLCLLWNVSDKLFLRCNALWSKLKSYKGRGRKPKERLGACNQCLRLVVYKWVYTPWNVLLCFINMLFSFFSAMPSSACDHLASVFLTFHQWGWILANRCINWLPLVREVSSEFTDNLVGSLPSILYTNYVTVCPCAAHIPIQTSTFTHISIY